jgi:hypothetical protein
MSLDFQNLRRVQAKPEATTTLYHSSVFLCFLFACDLVTQWKDYQLRRNVTRWRKPWSGVSQFVHKFPTSYITPKFITTLTRLLDTILSQINPAHTPHLLCALHFPLNFFHCFLVNFVRIFLITSLYATYSAQPILLHFMTIKLYCIVSYS